jgi:hypothetical protein
MGDWLEMNDEDRRAVDEACLELLGFEQNGTLPALWFGPYCSVTVGKDGPSENESLVVPLAEALCDKERFPPDGFHVTIRRLWLNDGWQVQLLRQGAVVEGKAGTIPEALAIAAARAVAAARGETK